MAHRQITDSLNCVWDVWEVIPSTAERETQEERRKRSRSPQLRRNTTLMVPEELKNGWLAFQCNHERRRMTPIPDDWIDMSDQTLLELLNQAQTVAPSARRPVS